ncbi:winged helix-turn-helix transcriptional regulator [Actinokineospora terrae]|uniref:winged helix-turn-helix transcriptional regulator n=1 Tax=Actinokineospora terrae TaxID=155974 RepID=UPI000B87998E|nr:helix-turn-helix domain-containing protein [Actinokineospora terrae]
MCEEWVADCRLRAGTDLFAHRWDPVLLAALRPAPLRRVDLRGYVGGISDKALTESLRRLLDRGLVERHRHAEAPPRVTYRLSALGVTLVDGPLRALGDWVLEHGDALLG